MLIMSLYIVGNSQCKFGFTKACAILDTMVGSLKMEMDEETKSEEVLLGKSENLNGTNLKLMSQCV